MIRVVLIAVAMMAYWLLLSGHYTLWMNSVGAISVIAIVAFAYAKGIVDNEGFAYERLPRAIFYWPWLAWQIVLSALNVTKLILNPRLPITPTMVRVKAKQESAVGLTTYANSITLTPGTISVEVSERMKCIWVHAITAEGAEGMAEDEMNDRVRYFEGGNA